MMQMGFYFDQSRCTGCYACVVACRDWYDITDTTVSWRRLIETETGRYPDVGVSYVSLACCHCATPACAAACPVEAIVKRPEDGVMVVNREECLGGDVCGACREACPYDVPQFGTEDNPRMQMCTMCRDRLADDQPPVCVAACPLRALDFGPLDSLVERYGPGRSVPGCNLTTGTEPSLVIKPRYEAQEDGR